MTPDHVRDLEFVDHQADLYYDPGVVKINEAELTGAFNFNGLLNFHGLQSQIRLVMDPSYQKYLYLSVILPSFSMSKDNIKFFSPSDYMQVFDEETKKILS